MTRDEWRRYLAPAAFLVAVTVAVVLIRAGLRSSPPGGSVADTVATAPSSSATSGRTGTRAAATTAARKRYWTVRAGDTFGVIAAHTGVPVATIERLNPNVKSTSLFIGEKIRIR